MAQTFSIRTLLGGLIAAAPGLLAAAEAQPTFPGDQIEFFEKSIRPILVESCQGCHGGHRHENGLRLDSRAAILRGSDYGQIVVAGNPEGSKLLKAVKHAPGVEAMPKKGDKLSASQVAALEKWVAMGLPWPQEKEQAVGHHDKPSWQEHWAFQKVTKPAEPSLTKLKGEVKNDVDKHVAAKLEEAGMAFAPVVDRATLGRRLYLDLTGLQPTFEDLQKFVNDKSPDAVAKLVDRLLDSPRYGERWARHWLDVARYSDVDGYRAGGVDNRFPYSYTYRDWVVQVLNKDLPYDQFITQQLAADKLLPPAQGQADPSLAALGFLTIGDYFLGDRLLQNDDRIDVVSRGMLGLTVACARCHDHKYDPIPSKDYYALYSVFNSSETPDKLPVIGEATDKAAAEDFKSKVAAIEKEMQTFRQEVYGDIRNSARLKEYLVFARKALELQSEQFRGEAGKAKLRDRYADGLRDMVKRNAYVAKPHPVMLAWKKLSDLPDGEFAAKAPALVQELTKPESPVNAVVKNELAKRPAPKTFDDVAGLYSDVFVTCITGKEPDNADWQAVRAMLMDGKSPMSVPVDQIDRFFTRKDREHMTQLENKITKLELTSEGAPQRAMVMLDKEKPADVKVMIRGNPGRQGEPAPRGFLTALGGQKFSEGSGRLELAKLIASKDNPLTARVIVNRVWMHHFGKPLVSQPTDFGVQTPKPDQAALLDYLAATFMEQGWSLKKLHRLILTSRTYQQSSTTTPEKELKDAENNLLSHFNRQRMDYENMRDNLLQVSGALNVAKAGGRSTLPETPDADSRRSVYLFVNRYEQATVPATFDFANPDTLSPQRFVTTVPQQTLFLMNSPFMKSRADQVAQKVPANNSGIDSESLKALYRQVLLREPSPDEVELAGRFVNDATSLQSNSPFTWAYGYGNVKRDAPNGPVEVQFNAFKKFFNDKKMGIVWQGGDKVPDPVSNYTFARLSAGTITSHVGDGDMANIIRWVAPSDAVIRISGTLQHGSPSGDGVTGWIVSSRTGLVKEAQVAPNTGRNMGVDRLEVKAGEVLDFCATAGPKRDNTNDGYRWTPRIERQDSAATGFTVWTDAGRDFVGPGNWPLNLARPQSPLSQLAHVLLMSNEFQFVE